MSEDEQDYELDPFEQCFSKRTPSLNYTFSFRKEPCRYEEPLDPRRGEPLKCPFRTEGYCEKVMSPPAPEIQDSGKSGEPVLQRVISRAYLERTKTVLSEPSTSVVIRSEQQFHLKDQFRLAQRRHFYEVVENGTPDCEERFGIDCRELLDPNDRLGEYLGFIDLREHFDMSPLAFALLVEPSWLREDPNTFVIRGDYGQLFGAHSFRSTIYSMQDPGKAGAYCAQMCAIMALGMLSDRCIEVKGSFTLTYLHWRDKNSSLQSRWENGNDLHEPGTLTIDGLRPEELSSVINECGGNSAPCIINGSKAGADALAIRVIEAYIKARFPVILAVDANAWYPQSEQSDSEEKLDSSPPAPMSHAVTIIGIRRSAADGDPKSFVVHDPSSGPFQLFSTHRCLTAARAFQICDEGTWRAADNIVLVTAATHSIKTSVIDCVYWLWRHDATPDKSVFSTGGSNAETFRPYHERDGGTDYQIRLINRNSLPRYVGSLLHQSDHQAYMRLKKTLVDLSESRYWVITGFRRDPRNARMILRVAWFFDARGEINPVCKLWRNEADALKVILLRKKEHE